MLPDHDHFRDSVSPDDAEPVVREIISPIPAGLRRIPDRETGLNSAPVPYHPAEQARGTT
jgi:hypothetical protein